jgi:hypothetical protein
VPTGKLHRAGRVGERATVRPRPTLPSSNRRCGFPASGSPENSRLRHAQVWPAWPFGPVSVSVEKLSPAPLAPSPFPASPFLRLPESPSRDLHPSGFLLLLHNHVFSKAPLLRGRYPASSLLRASPSPCWAAASVMSSRCALVTLVPTLQGLPGSSAALSTRAAPNHPGRPGGCLPVASPPVAGFILVGGLATFVFLSRPNRVHLRCGSRVRLPTRQPRYRCSRSLGYMLNRQFTW